MVSVSKDGSLADSESGQCRKITGLKYSLMNRGEDEDFIFELRRIRKDYLFDCWIPEPSGNDIRFSYEPVTEEDYRGILSVLENVPITVLATHQEDNLPEALNLWLEDNSTLTVALPLEEVRKLREALLSLAAKLKRGE
jgi:hypothetical protein